MEMLLEAPDVAYRMEQTAEVCPRRSKQKRFPGRDADGEGSGRSVAPRKDCILCGSYVGETVGEVYISLVSYHRKSLSSRYLTSLGILFKTMSLVAVPWHYSLYHLHLLHGASPFKARFLQTYILNLVGHTVRPILRVSLNRMS